MIIENQFLHERFGVGRLLLSGFYLIEEVMASKIKFSKKIAR